MGAGKNEVVGKAAGFLVPIQWDEPFGLAFIEALATGNPHHLVPARVAS